MSTSPSSSASAAIALAVTHVEHAALDLGDRSAAGDAAVAAATRSGCDPVSKTRSDGDSAGGESFDERAAETLVGARDKCNS